MATRPASRLGQLIEDYKRVHSASDTGLADRIGITRQTLVQWRNGELRTLPTQANLRSAATQLGCPYRTVLDAALYDTGYLTPPLALEPRAYADVFAEAVAILTEATHLTNQRVRRTATGGWEPDPDAPPDRIDWAAFVTEALAGATANAGGIDNVLAGRPGSWEAAVVRDVLNAAVGQDEWDLWRYRTEPVDIILKPEQILYDVGDLEHMAAYDDAEQELSRREEEISPSVPIKPGGLDWVNDPVQVAEFHAAIRAEAENPTPPTPEEQAIDDALAAVQALRDRLQAQQRAELADYGQALAAAVTEHLADRNLPVPVSVTVDLDAQLDALHGGGTPVIGEVTGAIDVAIADAIMTTPTPSALPGTPLERAEAALARDQHTPRNPE
ncbi:helix-turn-helix domain-containing protein [Mycobacterium intracellulare]|uniref:Helix-turn-helix transcriptional regulator n=1 Tax=Mycobacterium intracellulare subsp. chimaera TaxID=222805 RepID=A0ABT7P2B2_MYCIT|nr:helix-turn-helix transcriptional regulator [Mycobacterium intracellulare]MDM3927402.1 helix-turn-helix transcriptional regulator [Mycobacterium intracellulare subsp. chimaera]